VSRAGVAALRGQYIRETAREPWGEAAAVVVLLGFDPIAHDDRFAEHTSPSGVDWDSVMADKTWSPTERFLIATAAGLWSGRRTMADISRVTRLDGRFLRTWLEMISAAVDGRVPEGQP
jgi:hypothetical protein